ncbi:F390 synthetase-related protein [Bacillus dakarensis]|uniref:F390 synthetase-related protein n=1 Tax=Robertmurraya dakarensis TaxID=1926278 RepID=UPI00098268EB|nr:F390 synthetase-related protein [Bacillus dakarensis]
MKRLLQILSAYFKTKRMAGWTSREKLEVWQEKKLNQQLKYIKKRSPYFQRVLEGVESLSIKDLPKLPVMDKEVMMEHFDELNTVNIHKTEAFEIALKAEDTRDFSPMIGSITVGLSSGTSGNRGLFLVSEEERNMWAGTILAKLLPDGLKSKERIAFFLRANSNLYGSVTSNRISFAFFDLLDDLDVHVKRLNDSNPTILAAPPSMMRMLAEKKAEGILRISPKKIITMAEVLDPLDETMIEAAFGHRVHQVYQCTEGFLAATCSRGTLHLNEDIVIIEKEFLDEDRFSPIITDFTRKTQPIIRYKLNDILTLKKGGCSCGSPMTAIAQIEGRCDDIFYFKNKNDVVVPVFPDFIRRSVITASASIREYKVIQAADRVLEVQLAAEGDGIEEIVRKNLEDFFLRIELEVPDIRFTPYTPNQKLQKLKRIERKVDK